VLDEIPFEPARCQKTHAVMLTDDEARLIVVCEGNHEGPGTLLVVELASGEVESAVELGRFPDDVALLRPPR
jgi:hypothetical protein